MTIQIVIGIRNVHVYFASFLSHIIIRVEFKFIRGFESYDDVILVAVIPDQCNCKFWVLFLKYLSGFFSSNCWGIFFTKCFFNPFPCNHSVTLLLN